MLTPAVLREQSKHGPEVSAPGNAFILVPAIFAVVGAVFASLI
jgi:hypothetical protein